RDPAPAGVLYCSTDEENDQNDRVEGHQGQGRTHVGETFDLAMRPSAIGRRAATTVSRVDVSSTTPKTARSATMAPEMVAAVITGSLAKGFISSPSRRRPSAAQPP